MTPAPAALAPSGHALYRLAPDLLLVFKPRGHREGEHAHAHRQRLRVLRGRLAVRTRRSEVVLDPASPVLSMPAGHWHATEALSDVWLIAESRPAAARRAPRG
jgi:quercetin dioxygenase-like cupin family protein